MKSLCLTLLWWSFSLASNISFASSPSGDVIGWGQNESGVVTGVPTLGYASGTVKILGQPLRNVVAISAGGSIGLARRGDGTVVGWGNNQDGQVTGVLQRNNGPVVAGGLILSNVLSIEAGGSLALKNDGSVVTWGKAKLPIGLSNIVGIAAHEFSRLALKNDGTVVGWSAAPWSPMYAQLYPLAGLTNVAAIAVGGEGNVAHSAALTKDGKVVVWKFGFSDQETIPPQVTNVIAIAVGICHTLALKSDGTVFGWGCNSLGQATGVAVPERPDEVRISSGLVTIEGRVLSNVVAIAAANAYSMALKRDGTVVAWGQCPAPPPGLTNVVAIAAGRDFCLAIQRK